ncbi:MAG: tetratricopeptide repeat protein [Candidatus Eisenbacteria bacterium]|nr:tetratricopeptide repeat protein [Candidatus Eisenbacteria bacterium]
MDTDGVFSLPRLRSYIERLENAPHHWGYAVLTFLGVVIARNLLEGALGPKGALGFTYFASGSALMVLDHFLLFYVTLFLGFSLLLSLLARERIGRVMKVATPAWALVLIPPFLDYLISGGEGIRITYVSELGDVVFRFFDPRASLEYISPGQRVEILAACLLGAAYVRVKTRNWARAVAAFAGIYLVLAVAGFLPSAFARLSAAAGGHSVPPRTAYDLTFKAGGLVPDESRKLALLFLVSSSALAFLAYLRHAPARARAMLRGLRPLRSAHYVGLALFGAALAGAVFLHAQVRVGSGGDILGIVGTLAAVFFAFQSSAAVNDLFDVRADRIAGNPRPLARKELDRRDVAGQAAVLGIAGLLFALNVKYSTFLALLLTYAVSLIYSMPPLRLKRVPVLSTLTLGYISFLTAVVGFSLFAEERAFALFPPRLGAVLVLSFGLGFAAKDLKDVEGDRATGVVTLPVLFGTRKGRYIVAALVFASYAFVPALLRLRVLIVPSLVVAAASLALVLTWKRKNLDRVLLTVCLLFTLFVAVVVVTNPLEVARVDAEVAGGKAAEVHGRRARAMHDRPGAAAAYAEAAVAFPEAPSQQENAGVALVESGRFEEAVPFLRRAAALDPASPIALEYLSAALSRSGRPEAAERLIRESIGRGIRPRVFLSLLGERKLRRGDAAGAYSAYRAALATGQPDIPARLRLAEALAALGETDRAENELRETVRRSPSSAQAHDALGKFLNVSGEHAGAAREFGRAVELDPDEPVFWNNLGVALRLAGEYSRARDALAEATRLAPRMVDPYYNRAEIARALGEHEEARRQLLLALEIDPSFQPARRALERLHPAD